MSVSLVKGQKVDLTKTNPGLTNLIIGLGWDEAEHNSGKGLFSSLFSRDSSNNNIDCDASVILCQDGKCKNRDDVVYFGNLTHNSGAVKHMGDNLTGAGEGDDEQIYIELPKVPNYYDKMVFVVNIYEAIKRHQHFGMIKNAFIRVVDAQKNVELCRYNLSENYDNMYALIFGEIYRNNGEWKFNAIGQATQDAGVNDLVKRYI